MKGWRKGAVVAAGALGLGALLGGLALWRRDIPYSTLRVLYADARSRFVPLPDGTLVHLREVGPVDRPAIMCLHGYSASSLDWIPWAEAMGDAARLLLVDLPGHGLTETPPGSPQGAEAMATCVAAIVKALGLGRVVLAGNSMGGQVALGYTLRHPEAVAGLVLIASTGAADPGAERPPPSLIFRLLASPVGRWALRHLDLTIAVRRGLRDALRDKALVTPALVRRTADLARAPGHRAILTDLQLGGGGGPLLGRLHNLKVSALVLGGDVDRLVPIADVRAMAAALPDARLIVYPEVGHVPMLECPARCAADVRDWLATLPG